MIGKLKRRPAASLEHDGSPAGSQAHPESAREDKTMASPVIAPDADRETPRTRHTDRPNVSEPARFHRRYPARVQRIQARIEDERALLGLALATFQAELAAMAA